MHRTLYPMLLLPQLLGQRIGLVSAQARNRFKWIPGHLPRQIISASYKHLGMALNAWRDRHCDLYLISEHKADYSLPLYLVILFSRKPCFFFVHDMQQVATIMLRCRISLNICRWWVRQGEIYPLFISLDDRVLPLGSRFESAKELTIPHPHHLAENPPPPRPPLKPGHRFPRRPHRPGAQGKADPPPPGNPAQGEPPARLRCGCRHAAGEQTRLARRPGRGDHGHEHRGRNTRPASPASTSSSSTSSSPSTTSAPAARWSTPA